MKTKNRIYKYGKLALIIGLTLTLGIIIGSNFFGSGGVNHDEHSHAIEGEAEATIYTCSMHPQIKQNEPGLCPICAMDLVPLNTQESGDEDVGPGEIQMTQSAIELANIETVIVSKGIPEKSVYLLGKVKPDERNIAELTARYGGRIEKLYVNYTGQHVSKGQKLGSIYSPDLITAQRELLEAIKYKETNPSFYTASRSKLKLWNLTEDQIDDIENKGEPIHFFNILSPITGTVTQRHVSVGDYVVEGSALFEVIDLTRVWVMFDAYESDLPWIKTGDMIEFSLQSVPGKTFTSKVSYIDPFIDPVTRVAQVRVVVSNPDMELKPEMFANGILESTIAESSDQLLIPKSAILWTGKRAVVFVKVPDRELHSFIYREIILGPEAGNFYVVSSGLHEGEEIAMNGVFKIDAAAQLAGKPSMMNPEGGKISTGHDHGEMEMGDESTDYNTQSETKADHAMTTVYGNCGMCKDRIETAANSLEGVLIAEWDSDSQMLHLEFNPAMVSTMDVEKAIAAVGHDTEHHSAPDDVYEALPGCCLYDRPGK
ncbi:MAG: efflux RND transporter periplasmic adaptor subunit [Bacteroidetes bacterium]|nr:MAG: efflux RND transporter periplasmic adaptor subunit [Bacteroidota bacterium]